MNGEHSVQKLEYAPANYWEKRLLDHFDLTGVGHLSFGPRYNRWLYKRKFRQWRRVMNGHDLKNKRVLDIGAGTGFWTDAYRQRDAIVYGVDLTEVSVNALSTKYPEFKFIKADVASPKFPTIGKFDIVNIWDVLYHIVSPEGFEAAAKNIRACANSNTKVIVTDQFESAHDQRVSEHVQFRSLSTYKKVWEPLGFRLECQLPLYHWLNCYHSLFGNLSDSLGAMFYFLDLFQRKPSRTNISLTTWVLQA